MTIIANDPNRGNNIQTIDFNGQSLITIEKDGIHYAAVKPIAENIGLNWNSQHNRITRDDVLNSVVVMMTTTGTDGKQYEMTCLPIDYLNGWLFGIDAKRVKPEIKAPLIQYKMQCYKALYDYWHTGAAVHPSVNEELPSSVKDRNGLIKAARMAQARLAIGYDEVFNLIHHRFNINRISELTVSQVGEATEYIQRLVLNQIAEPYRKSEHAQAALTISDEADDPTEYGAPVTMVNQTMASGKFFGTIDSNGRMTMRELGQHEFITSLEALPIVIANNRFDGHVLASIGVAVSHKLYRDTYNQRPSSFVTDTQGVIYDR